MRPRITFSNTNPAFSVALKRKVDDFFVSKKVPLTGNKKLYLKTAVLLSFSAALYFFLVFSPLPVWLSLLFCVLLGLALAAIGFNVMHDGAHGSYSRKTWINETMAYSLNLMGGSSFLWKQKHNVNHHTFTNLDGLDDDIDIQPWIRTSSNQPRRWFHRYQHIYWVFLYGIAYFSWVFFKDFGKYFSGKIADTPIKKMNLKEHVIFWMSKLVYLFVFLLVPAWRIGVQETLIGYAVISFVCGFVISIIFQMAHIVEGSSFPLLNKQPQKLENDWTIHQLLTTANFSTKNPVISWFAGGLNFQIEHHLFPRISHVHYPAISKLVKEVCAEFNVRYTEYPTLLSAVRSHVTYLKNVGRE